MSLGANLSSGYTAQLRDKVLYDGITKTVSIAYSDSCCKDSGVINETIATPTASQPSMVIFKNRCPPPTPAEFTLYPKVAIPSSVRLQQQISSCLPYINADTRFDKYKRFQVPVPCPPLAPSANMAGKSLPSSLQCNIYPNT